MQIEGIVGAQSNGEGAKPAPRMTRTGALGVADCSARYTELAARGQNLFFACNSASQALSLNSLTATGFILTNPAGSGKIIALVDVCVALLTAPAGISNLILTGATSATLGTVTHSAALTVRNSVIGGVGGTAVGLADSSATLPTGGNTILRPIGGGPVATGSVTSPFIRDEIAGSIQLYPGAFISLQCLTTAISVIASMTWEEIGI